MLIGELVEKSGLTKDTIRYYERAGLFTPPVRRENNYKEYEADTMSLLKFVRQLQAGGFTLAEIRNLIEVSESHAITCGEVSAVVQQKLEELNQRIVALQTAKERLSAAFDGCEGSTDKDVCTPIDLKQLSH